MTGPLAGVRVVDFSAVISGPLSTMLLADQGADVIKVEGPKRMDLLRKEWYARGGLTAMFANTNRGKRSLVVDLQHEHGVEIGLALCRWADVLVENFRPGVMERLGLGPERLHAENPRLVYCRVSGYGQTGPWSQRRAYDPVVQGMTGYVAIQKNPDIPIPDLVRTTVVDKAAAYTAAQAITAALFARERGETGQTISVSLLDAGLAFFWPDGMMKHTLLGDGVREGPAIYDRYRLTETKDGHVIVWAGGDNEWHAVFRGLDRDDLCKDERFAKGKARAVHAEALAAILESEFKRRTTAEIMERMEAADAPAGPVIELEDLPMHRQAQHNAATYETEHPTAGRLRQARPAPEFSKTPAGPGPVAPLLGEHSDEILAELGFDAVTISALRTEGVIR